VKIVGITGTGYPFPRFVDGLAAHATSHPDAEVWVQHGKAPLTEPLIGASLIPRDDLLERMRQADAVVSHGGSGSIADAIAAGHVPVVVPRLERLGEHVNDHQLEIVEALGEDGRIVPLHDLAMLSDAIDRAQQQARRGARDEPGAMLRSAIAQEIAERGTRRRLRTGLVWSLLEVAGRLAVPQRMP
jgi:UDP-N-acetylglucosamine transferase subunit ALG13